MSSLPRRPCLSSIPPSSYTNEYSSLLRFLLRGPELSYPSNATYNTSLASYWALQEAQIHPSCVFSPKNSEDVSVAVFVLNIEGKVFPGHCQFATRSGG